MELISEFEINFSNISLYKLNDIFPKDFFFENQFSNNKNFKTKILDGYNMKNQIYNSKKLQYNKNEEPLELDEKIKINDFHIIENTNNDMIVCDVKVGFDNIIFSCGEKFVKIYWYDSTLKKDYLLFNLENDDKYNCLAFSNWFKFNENNVIMNKNKNIKNENSSNAFEEKNIQNPIKPKENNSNNEEKLIFLVAFAGANSIIRILMAKQMSFKENSNFIFFEEYTHLIGHRNEIFDLKFHPLNNEILISCGKDFSIRIWNALKNLQLCIIAGPECHLAEILSIDIHLSGNYIVSGGVDSYIKIYDISTNDIFQNINKSIQPNFQNDLTYQNIKPIIKQPVIFYSNSIHENYIDCVKFKGNFILSKSIDGIIIEWFPNFNKGMTEYFVISTFDFKITEYLWFLRFDLSSNYEWLGVGNNFGEVYLYKLDNEFESNQIGSYNDVFRIKEKKYYNTGILSIIRKVAFHENLEYIVFCNDKGQIFINDLNEKFN